MKKLVTVVGARPQFIKAAMGSRALRQDFLEVLVHTGQHHDANMSDVFFQEMGIPKPDYNLGIAGGSHAEMTGRMLAELEKMLLTEQPDALLVYGDTNSTLAAALAAAKLLIPVVHAEAGNRLGTLKNPEELNRVCTDHVSSLLLACTQSAMGFLAKENLAERAHLVGDPMYDAFCYYTARLDGSELDGLLDFDGVSVAVPPEFYYMTCHRQENTDTDEKLSEILSAMDALDAPTIYPVHPRNHARAARLCANGRFANIVLTQPVGYQTSISLVNRAKKIVTDSGGLQREAFFAGKPCVTVLEFVVWPETMVGGCNVLAKPSRGDILEKLSRPCAFDPAYQPFGDGHSAEKIVKKIGEFLK